MTLLLQRMILIRSYIKIRCYGTGGQKKEKGAGMICLLLLYDVKRKVV
jgi:hypothetical protein